jgi:hypothetical protein
VQIDCLATRHSNILTPDARALEKFDVVVSPLPSSVLQPTCSPHPLSCFSQITTYQVVASEHATYLASKAKEVDSGDSDSEENSFGSSLGKPNKKGTKKPAPTKKKAAGKSFCALFGVKWHRIVLGAPVSVLDSRCTKLISSDHP